jgi:heme/copper-type cytochrome/quinol oxidase subunit 2
VSRDANTAVALAFWAAVWLFSGADPSGSLWPLLFDDEEALGISLERAAPVRAGDPVPVLVTLSQYRFTPGGPDGPPIALQAGVVYQITFRSVDVAHGVSAIPQLGIDGREVAPGDDYVVTIQPSVAGLYAFACTRVCGGGHGGMRGAIEVTAPTPERASLERARLTRVVPPRDPR